MSFEDGLVAAPRGTSNYNHTRVGLEEEEGVGLLTGGTLVVCPTTVLHQWFRELSEKVNRAATKCSIHVYHGKVRRHDEAGASRDMCRGSDDDFTFRTRAAVLHITTDKHKGCDNENNATCRYLGHCT